jgi:hypothetical protein
MLALTAGESSPTTFQQRGGIESITNSVATQEQRHCVLIAEIFCCGAGYKHNEKNEM